MDRSGGLREFDAVHPCARGEVGSRQLKNKFARPVKIFNRDNPSREDIPVPRIDTYYLTPTGRVDVFSNQSSRPLR